VIGVSPASGPDCRIEPPVIRVTDLGYAPDGYVILDQLSLELSLGGTTAFVGSSGCGKSTLLRLIAGLRTPTSGQVAGTPERRAYVFQDHALLPWLTLSQNVMLPGRYRAGTASDPTPILARLGLSEHADKLPHALSGGQRMRGSIARALYAAPEIVFLDEAFSALDGITRASVQADFQRVAAAEGWTVLMVTHSVDEAIRLADRVVIVSERPARIVHSAIVVAPRPRDIAALGDLRRTLSLAVRGLPHSASDTQGG